MQSNDLGKEADLKSHQQGSCLESRSEKFGCINQIKRVRSQLMAKFSIKKE